MTEEKLNCWTCCSLLEPGEEEVHEVEREFVRSLWERWCSVYDIADYALLRQSSRASGSARKVKRSVRKPATHYDALDYSEFTDPGEIRKHLRLKNLADDLPHRGETKCTMYSVAGSSNVADCGSATNDLPLARRISV